MAIWNSNMPRLPIQNEKKEKENRKGEKASRLPSCYRLYNGWYIWHYTWLASFTGVFTSIVKALFILCITTCKNCCSCLYLDKESVICSSLISSQVWLLGSLMLANLCRTYSYTILLVLYQGAFCSFGSALQELSKLGDSRQVLNEFCLLQHMYVVHCFNQL